MEFGTWQTVLAGALIVVSVYYYFLRKLNYWKNKGVEGPGPVESVSDLLDMFLMRKSPQERINESYKKWRKYPFFGIGAPIQPLLIINDLDLIKSILIKDFHIFCGRGIKVNEDIEPLGAHLFLLSGDRWKALRTKLTPVFTSGKLKHMFDLMLECADHFEKYIKKEVDAGNDIEFREASAKFTTDIIGSCAFGLEMNALSNDDSEFRNMGRRIFGGGRLAFLKRILGGIFPKIFALLNIHIIDVELTNFFISSVKQTIAYRQRENIVRHDLIDTLMEIQKTHDGKMFKVTDELLAAQAFVFFIAGFETSSTTISFALYELAYEPEVQEKLINEILQTLEKNDGKLTYTIVNEMKYLEMVIEETLRKNPPVPLLQREANENYTMPGSNVTINAGTIVVLPIYSIQHDAEYFPDPERFDPERFSEEMKHTRHPMAHLPFGDGPKNCIGARFAAYQVKLGLIKILKDYRVRPTKLSPYPYEIDTSSFITKPKGGIHLKLEPIT